MPNTYDPGGLTEFSPFPTTDLGNWDWGYDPTLGTAAFSGGDQFFLDTLFSLHQR